MAFKDRFYDKPVLGTALRVQDRYKADAANELAASIGFFGFLSLFPLIIIAVAVGGFIIDNTPGADVDVAQAIEDAVPGLGGEGTNTQDLVADVAANAGAIAGVGALTLLISGLRVVSGAMIATTRVFRHPTPEGPKAWGRRLGALVVLGALALAGAVASSAAGIDVDFIPRPVAVTFSVLVTFAFDVLLFLVAYRILTAMPGPPWRALLPGALLAGAGWTLLKTFGSTYAANQVSRANELYGVFATVIALLLLFYLAGRLYLYGAELSALLCGAGDDDSSRPHAGASDDEEERVHEVGHPARPAGVPAPVRVDDFEDPHQDPAKRSGAGSGDRRRPGADDPSPAVTPATRDRVAQADRHREPEPHPVRSALAFLVAMGAVGGLVAAWKPWEQDD